MGSGRYDASQYSAYRDFTVLRDDGSRKSVHEVFTKKQMSDEFNPKLIQIRESRDSDDNPNSNAIIIALDVSGSMGIIADRMIGESLGSLMDGIMSTKPVSDPHIMFMAVGDVYYDQSPLQVTQFEADLRIAQQLTQIHVEGGGGGNHFESYNLPWHFAATKTVIDCFEKRGKKGYLFTIGDEMVPQNLNKRDIAGVYNVYPSTPDLSNQSDVIVNSELLAEAEKKYNVFHLIIEEGSYCSRYPSQVKSAWRGLMNDHAVCVKNYNHIAEIILAVIRVNEGENPEQVIASFQDGNIQDSIRYALFNTNQ